MTDGDSDSEDSDASDNVGNSGDSDNINGPYLKETLIVVIISAV